MPKRQWKIRDRERAAHTKKISQKDLQATVFVSSLFRARKEKKGKGKAAKTTRLATNRHECREKPAERAARRCRPTLGGALWTRPTSLADCRSDKPLGARCTEPPSPRFSRFPFQTLSRRQGLHGRRKSSAEWPR